VLMSQELIIQGNVSRRARGLVFIGNPLGNSVYDAESNQRTNDHTEGEDDRYELPVIGDERKHITSQTQVFTDSVSNKISITLRLNGSSS